MFWILEGLKGEPSSNLSEAVMPPSLTMIMLEVARESEPVTLLSQIIMMLEVGRESETEVSLSAPVSPLDVASVKTIDFVTVLSKLRGSCRILFMSKKQCEFICPEPVAP